MEWQHIVKTAIDIMESRLADPDLTVERIAAACFLPANQLQRAFSVLTGMTVGEYVRNRRMDNAGMLLQTPGKSVLSVSQEVGYDTPESFSKAFRRFRGILPGEAARKSGHLRRFHPLHVQVVLRQSPPLRMRMEDRRSFCLIGTMKWVPAEDDEAVTALWAQMEQDDAMTRLQASHSDLKYAGVYRAGLYTIRMGALGSVSKGTGMTPDEEVVSAGRWAVFFCAGTTAEGVDDTWNRIYSEWLSETPFRMANLPQLEIYSSHQEEEVCEIWIPLEEED